MTCFFPNLTTMTMNQCSACDSKLCLSACCGSKAAALSSISLPAKEMTFLHHGKHYMQGTSDTCLAFRFCQKENYSRSIETTQSSCSNFWIFWTLGVCSFPMFPFRFSDHRLVVAKSSSIQASRQ